MDQSTIVHANRVKSSDKFIRCRNYSFTFASHTWGCGLTNQRFIDLKALVDKPNSLVMIPIGISIGIAAIALLVFVSLLIHERRITQKQVKLVGQIAPSRENILIVCYGQISNQVKRIVYGFIPVPFTEHETMYWQRNPAEESQFDNRVKELSNRDGKIYELQVYHDMIEYFKLVILMLTDDDINRSNY
ncbi:hypothetical protein TrispH2_011472 [Trichoplax sp. H2]|nr:hypothetical protein TrispH2_011472 [Trichoplax sp. H2]|eukprot:RDD36527.1 hypothetical protein TrispH2_011472 [Trichoplax sp. H2]